MKSHFLQSLLVVGSVALAAIPSALGTDARDVFTRMDADNNGRITASEHDQFADTLFRQSDADRDGKVTVAECVAAVVNRDEFRADRQATEAKVRLIDTDGDGLISPAENAAYAKSEFNRADRNGDGSVSLGEVEAAQAAMNRG